MNIYEDCTEVRPGYGEFAVSVYACFNGNQQVTNFRGYEHYKNSDFLLRGQKLECYAMYNTLLDGVVTNYKPFNAEYFPIALSDGFLRLDKETWKLQTKYANLPYNSFGLYDVQRNPNYISISTNQVSLGCNDYPYCKSLFNKVVTDKQHREFLIPRKVSLPTLLHLLDSQDCGQWLSLYLLDYNLHVYHHQFDQLNPAKLPSISKAIHKTDYLAISNIISNGGGFVWS